MTHSLTLLGGSADFQPLPVPGTAPEWEHTLLLRRPDCEAIAIDRFRPGRVERLGRVGPAFADAAQAVRLARALRGRPKLLAQSEQSGYLAAFAAVPGGQRLFVIYHGHRWWERRQRAFAALARRLGRVEFLCLSRALADILVGELGMPIARVHVTGYGADAAYFCPSSAPAGDGPAPVVAAGSASRDYRTLVEASRDLAVPVEVAADSTWFREALDLGAEALPAHVRVFSAGGYGRLRSLYARSAFVVVPLRPVRFAAGYAVIAEAMAMGRAVIATRTEAPSDLIEDGVTGLLVPPGDAGALGDAMRTLLADPARASAMGAAGRRAVEAGANLDAYVGRLTEVVGLRPTPREEPAAPPPAAV